MTDLMEMVREAQRRYDALTPEEKVAHDYEQRRSFVRGMCPSDRNIDEWNALVDKLLPPVMPPPGVPLAWVIGKLKKITNTGQSIEPDHWKYRCMAREVAEEVIGRLEGRQ